MSGRRANDEVHAQVLRDTADDLEIVIETLNRFHEISGLREQATKRSRQTLALDVQRLRNLADEFDPVESPERAPILTTTAR